MTWRVDFFNFLQNFNVKLSKISKCFLLFTVITIGNMSFRTWMKTYQKSKKGQRKQRFWRYWSRWWPKTNSRIWIQVHSLHQSERQNFRRISDISGLCGLLSEIETFQQYDKWNISSVKWAISVFANNLSFRKQTFPASESFEQCWKEIAIYRRTSGLTHFSGEKALSQAQSFS